MNLVTTRTITAALTNDREGVVRNLDSLGRSGSKIWNVARWTTSRIWDEIGEIPDEGPLKSYMKNQDCWKDLNAQSSQAIVEELAGAFYSWFEQDDPDANPPGYRKHGDQRPRTTITFKEDGFKLDTEHQQVRLSKGKNLKDGWSDFILCEYDTGPDTDLTDVESVQQVRIVWNGDHWDCISSAKLPSTRTTRLVRRRLVLTSASATRQLSQLAMKPCCIRETRSKKTPTTSARKNTERKVRTAPATVRSGHEGRSLDGRTTSCTQCRKILLRSALIEVSAR